MRRVIQNKTITNLKDIIKEEVETYINKNKIDKETAEELKFICNSFAKYYQNLSKTERSDKEILKGFDASIEAVKMGAFGKSLVTYAPELYKDIEIINRIYKRTNEIEKPKPKPKPKKKDDDLFNSLISKRPTYSSPCGSTYSYDRRGGSSC